MVINHGIEQTVLEEALSAASEFFRLPKEEKKKLMSKDVKKPVRENMGKYAIEVRKFALKIMGSITESLGIGPTYLSTKLEEGMQVMAVNCYLLLVPEIKGALQVHLGDHFEVLSNGMYRSVVHRATLQRDTTRYSIASLHSLGMDEKMEIAKELMDQGLPKGYRESSF
ncbi:Flavanone 3-dioxygenase 3 [Camellia lanceoleosa]|uniref:Flavanone 3-dioxygenase 3 n=1 Tax=Camellia lanceoleosa TaxID=1840588 RepID=A0ACC0J3H3_9ERIC|nr:Flavanone 3-dioxygenase 3 [Camellia lanceoleosa]